MGWFGTRGIASVVFTLVALEELESGSAQMTPLAQVATWTILLSVVAHGVTAGPMAARYGARIRALSDVPELSPTQVHRVRRRALSRPGSHDAGAIDTGGRQP
jgi:NhaP-type Na+/H+ or K+/H+ antiporter